MRERLRICRYHPAAVLAVLILCAGFAGQASAAGLGRIHVTSRLGELFFAEVPLMLAPGEALEKLDIGLAGPDDYRLLEMYRDPEIQKLRVKVVHDTRGDRINILSEQPIEAPFFNLVLKLRRGHATQFKRYPVFLELPGIQVSAPVARPITPAAPVTAASGPETGPAAEAAEPPAKAARSAPGPAFKSFDGWARIGRYGPMVFGDTISTVARRIRLDDRFTEQQVMAALYVKNSDKFIEHNINMIKAGTFLDVPTAAEVEAISPRKAKAMLAEHARRWRKLKRQPRFAAVDEAQKHRYSKRVRIGRQAVGEVAPPTQAKGSKASGVGAAVPAPKQAATGTKDIAELVALRQRNEKLAQQLRESERTIASLKAAPPPTAEVLGANARIKKLELRLARLQAELNRARQEASQNAREMGLLDSALAAAVVLLLAALGYLLMRQRRLSSELAAVEQDTPVAAPAAGGFLADETAEKEAVAMAAAEPAGETEAEPATEPAAQAGDEETQQVRLDETSEVEGPDEARPDANVDYVAEADVYLRYGMEEDAIQQLRQAIQQNEANAEAHSKLVQVLYSQGDRAALEEAIAHGARALSGEDLSRFEEAVASLDLEEEEAAEIKTLPTKEYVAGEESPSLAEGTSVPEAESGGEASESDTLEWSSGDDAGEGQETPSPDEPEGSEAGGLEFEIGEPLAETQEDAGVQEEPSASEVLGDEDGLEFGDLDASLLAPEAEDEPPVAEAAESVAAPEGETGAETPSEPTLEENEELELGGLDWLEEDEEDVQQKAAPGGETAAEEPLLTDDELPPAEMTETVQEKPEADDEPLLDGLDWADEDEASQGTAAVSSDEAAGQAEEQGGVTDADRKPVPDDGLDLAGLDSIPDDAGADSQPEVAANVDHLAEAEAHLRFGMEDEAVQHLQQAIEENGQNAAAHCKLIQVLYNQGKQQELEKAIVRGAEMLAGDALQRFMEAVSELDMEEAEAEEVRALLKKGQAAESGGTTVGPESLEDDAASKGAEAEETMLDLGAADEQAFDISEELDGLLAELDADAAPEAGAADETPDVGVSPESLHVDMGRSQLAEGELEAAEQSFTAALDGEHGCEARLGLAEVALQRGDADRAKKLLAEAESMLTDETRPWYERLTGDQAKE